ncbi:MAG TPA: aerial mycelium formation protein [Acidimicrobiia bacterium]|nr:aerial mycelium formation protein [Acidimicrobiia bacterium]
MATDTAPERRRLDQVLEPEFVDGLDALDLDDLRARRDMADEVETELSYYRRLLHGRMDLLAFEQRRRKGDEDRSLIDALPEILVGRERPGVGSARHLSTDLPPLPIKGRRLVDRVLGNDLMIRLPELSIEDLAEAAVELAEVENELSATRGKVQEILDHLQAEVVARYKHDLGDPALRPS